MPVQSPTIAMSALHSILNWSVTRPDWQRDALRRIVAQGTLQEADLNELGSLCRAKHNAVQSNGPAIACQPLTANHLPPPPGAESSVILLALANLQRVNRLPSDQTLTFGDGVGLTVVYGDNGSGKSGYARVIKKACRTRGTPVPIKPNVYSQEAPAPASATITCRVGASNHTVTWTDKVESDPRLANIFVFDTFTAGHYLQEDGPAAFTPRGLDVLPKLSKACDLIAEYIRKDINGLKDALAATAKNWKYPTATKVATLLAGLSAKTLLPTVDALATLAEADLNRLAELDEALKSNPAQKALETRASATRLRAFVTKLSDFSRDLSDTQCVSIRQMISTARSAATAAKSFATGRFDATYLPGTGSEVWRVLFEAARSFAAVAYKDQDFPLTSDGTNSSLCPSRACFRWWSPATAMAASYLAKARAFINTRTDVGS
jgi:hypothetical protein